MPTSRRSRYPRPPDSVAVGENLDGGPEDVFERGAGRVRGEQRGGVADRPGQAAVGAQGAAAAKAGGEGGSFRRGAVTQRYAVCTCKRRALAAPGVAAARKCLLFLFFVCTRWCYLGSAVADVGSVVPRQSINMCTGVWVWKRALWYKRLDRSRVREGKGRRLFVRLLQMLMILPGQQHAFLAARIYSFIGFALFACAPRRVRTVISARELLPREHPVA